MTPFHPQHNRAQKSLTKIWHVSSIICSFSRRIDCMHLYLENLGVFLSSKHLLFLSGQLEHMMPTGTVFKICLALLQLSVQLNIAANSSHP